MKSIDYLPSSRGFDRYFGYYTGVMDYWAHYDDLSFGEKALDLHRADGQPGLPAPVRNTTGRYSTTMFASKATEWIGDHPRGRPMFLYLAFQSMHSANNKFLQAPPEYLERFDHLAASTCGQYQLSANCTPGAQRKSVAAIVSAMDDGVGDVVAALAAAKMTSNTLLIFSKGSRICPALFWVLRRAALCSGTDNGGPTNGSNANNANNWPLRGCKGGYFEGGVRGVGLIHGAGLERVGYWNAALFQVVDW